MNVKDEVRKLIKARLDGRSRITEQELRDVLMELAWASSQTEVANRIGVSRSYFYHCVYCGWSIGPKIWRNIGLSEPIITKVFVVDGG